MKKPQLIHGNPPGYNTGRVIPGAPSRDEQNSLAWKKYYKKMVSYRKWIKTQKSATKTTQSIKKIAVSRKVNKLKGKQAKR